VTSCGPAMLFYDPVSDWWRWFAWYPIRTWDRRLRWLCWVERRLLQKKIHLCGPMDSIFQHRVIGT